MPTVEDLGRVVKAKYPGQYDDLADAEVGQKVKGKFPGAYDDFADVAAPPQVGEARQVPPLTPEEDARRVLAGPSAATQRGMKQGVTAGLGSKAGAAIDATAAAINQWAREHAPALVPEQPTVTEQRTGGPGGGLSWSERYEIGKRANQAADEAARAQSPMEYGVGEAVGSLAPASQVLGAAKGASLVGRSVGLGALQGAGESRGTTVGDLVGDAAHRAALGALAALPVAAIDKLPGLRDWLARRAGVEAFKQAAAGNAKSLARQVGGIGRAEEIGTEMLERGMLKGGDQPADILAKAVAGKQAAGEAIGQAVRESGATVNLPSLIDKLQTGVLGEAQKGGSLYSGVASKVAGHIDDLKAMQAAMGDDVPASALHGLKVKLGNAIDWRADKPLAEALQQAYGIESGAITKGVSAAGAGEQLVSANRGFGLMADLEKVAGKGAEGEANRWAGMSEQLGAGFGGVAGAITGHALGTGPMTGLPGAVAGGAAAHYWRLHGSGLAARGMYAGAGTISALTDKLAQNPRFVPYADLLRRTAATAGPAAAASAHFLLFDKDPAYRQAVTGEQ